MKKQEEYLRQQKEFEKEFPIGAKVRVYREAKGGENGWNNGWTTGMNIGDEGKIVFVSDRGVRIEKNGFNYPFFCLEKVVRAEFKDGVKVEFVNPPIPIRSYDYVAYNEAYNVEGWGSTEEEARGDLAGKLEEWDETS